ncbi:MAG: hypothetical protein KDC95_21005 [Planctomycetes bacterium]|nr:hypothetical protein [Planctomycetota bacterium]
MSCTLHHLVAVVLAIASGHGSIRPAASESAASESAASEPAASETASAAVVVLESGKLRTAIPAAIGIGPVVLTKGGVVVGRGEVVPMTPLIAELRADVSVAGECRLRPLARVPVREARSSLSFDGARAATHADGEVVPRFVQRSSVPGARVSAEWFEWPDGGIELRMHIETKSGFETGTSLEFSFSTEARAWHGIELRGASITIGERRGAQVGAKSGVRGVLADADGEVRTCVKVRVPGERLRPGDALFLVVGAGACRADPTLAVQPVASLLELVEQSPRVTLACDPGLAPAFAKLCTRLANERPRDALSRGDDVRRILRTEAGSLRYFSHGEFDSSLAWLLRASRLRATTRDAARDCREALSLALDSLHHTIERNLARGSIRLPVKHGTRHGFGEVDFGHVFLEGAMLTSLCTSRRLELDATITVLDTLEQELVRDDRRRALRELVWPLRNCTVAAIVLARGQSLAARERILTWIDDGCVEAGWPDWPDNRVGETTRRVELWFVAGLLLPTLRLAARSGSERATRQLHRWVESLRGLPWNTLGPAPTIFLPSVATKDGKCREARGAGDDACFEAWCVEGVAQVPALTRFAKRWSSVVSRRLAQAFETEAFESGATSWDPATAFALCARLSWLQPAISASARSSGQKAARPSGAKPKGVASDRHP